MRKRTKIPLVVCLLVFTGCTPCAECHEKEEEGKGHQKQKIPTELFASVDDAMSVLLDRKSALRWEASRYLKEHPANAIAKLKLAIEQKDPSYFIAMHTLTDIGGEAVVRFYCDLLDKNRYEVDRNGKRKVYGSFRSRNFYGEAIVKQIGKLGDKAADPCLQRAWLDSDDAVRAAIPKARYDIGALSITDLLQLARTDAKCRDIYGKALVDIAWHNIHEKTDTAIEICEQVCALSEAGNQVRASAHIWLVQCYELKKDYEEALTHCDWVIENADNKEFSSRFKIQRPVLLFHQGKLTLDDLFASAKKENKLYDRIAQLGRFKDISILDRIIKEAPPNSKYAMEAQYWKLEYFDVCDMPERAKSQAEFILENCKYDYVLNWVRSRMAKEKEVTERTSRSKVR